MLNMLIFWIVYGLWFSVVWGGALIILANISDAVVKWITNEDHNLKKVLLKIEPLLATCWTIIPLFFGFIILIAHTLFILVGNVLNKSVVVSFHEIAVIVSGWVSVNMTTPVLIVIALGGMLLFAKKVYPFFKKLKIAVDKLD